jgi:hypothetical protein
LAAWLSGSLHAQTSAALALERALARLAVSGDADVGRGSPEEGDGGIPMPDWVAHIPFAMEDDHEVRLAAAAAASPQADDGVLAWVSASVHAVSRLASLLPHAPAADGAGVRRWSVTSHDASAARGVSFGLPPPGAPAALVRSAAHSDGTTTTTAAVGDDLLPPPGPLFLKRSIASLQLGPPPCADDAEPVLPPAPALPPLLVHQESTDRAGGTPTSGEALAAAASPAVVALRGVLLGGGAAAAAAPPDVRAAWGRSRSEDGVAAASQANGAGAGLDRQASSKSDSVGTEAAPAVVDRPVPLAPDLPAHAPPLVSQRWSAAFSAAASVQDESGAGGGAAPPRSGPASPPAVDGPPQPRLRRLLSAESASTLSHGTGPATTPSTGTGGSSSASRGLVATARVPQDRTRGEAGVAVGDAATAGGAVAAAATITAPAASIAEPVTVEEPAAARNLWALLLARGDSGGAGRRGRVRVAYGSIVQFYNRVFVPHAVAVLLVDGE